MIAILVNIRSAYNVGSFFRTADAAGIEKIYLTGITPSPIDRFGRKRKDISKISLGAENFVSWEYCKSTLLLMTKLKKEGYKIIALEQDKKSIPYTKIKKSAIPDSKLVILVGNEINGLSREILKKADTIIEIPMFGKKESLNVTVAFGIAIFQIQNTKIKIKNNNEKI